VDYPALKISGINNKKLLTDLTAVLLSQAVEKLNTEDSSKA